MAMSKQTFKLCYVHHNILYFTDSFEKQWGDDWDDAPYEHNAGEPYEWEDDWTPEQNRKHGHAHIRYIAYQSRRKTPVFRHGDIRRIRRKTDVPTVFA